MSSNGWAQDEQMRQGPPPPAYGPRAVPAYTAPRAEVVSLACTGLPGVVRGVGELEKVMRWPHEFVRAWSRGGSGRIPRMPSAQVQGTLFFYTALVVQWHLTFFEGDPEADGRVRDKRPRGRRRGVKSESGVAA